eukprot:2737851-Prorocentrum_lima.AAC.1
METGVPGRDWCLKLHVPMKWKPGVVEEQFKLFKDKWEDIRTYVPINLSSTFYDKGDLMEA